MRRLEVQIRGAAVEPNQVSELLAGFLFFFFGRGFVAPTLEQVACKALGLSYFSTQALIYLIKCLLKLVFHVHAAFYMSELIRCYSKGSVKMLARRHLFEFNDESWAPEALRTLIVESLGQNSPLGAHAEGGCSTFS